MHELSLSQSILRTAMEAAGARRDRIRALTVKVGALSSVSVPTLEFCMGLVLEQEGIEGVAVRVEQVQARAHCSCGNHYAAEDLFAGCPRCGGFDRQIVEGQDVTLESIEVEDGEDQGRPVG